MMWNVMWKWGLQLPSSVSDLARFPAVSQDVVCEPVRRLNQKGILRQKNGSWQVWKAPWVALTSTWGFEGERGQAPLLLACRILPLLPRESKTSGHQAIPATSCSCIAAAWELGTCVLWINCAYCLWYQKCVSQL